MGFKELWSDVLQNLAQVPNIRGLSHVIKMTFMTIHTNILLYHSRTEMYISGMTASSYPITGENRGGRCAY